MAPKSDETILAPGTSKEEPKKKKKLTKEEEEKKKAEEDLSEEDKQLSRSSPSPSGRWPSPS